MEIHYNEEFGSFEVTKCDGKFGKSIILDGESMIPAAALEVYKTAIKQKICLTFLKQFLNLLWIIIYQNFKKLLFLPIMMKLEKLLNVYLDIQVIM